MRLPTIRECTFAAATAAAAVTAWASAVTLFRLAEHCAIESPYAAALPVAIDLGATVGALAWIAERGPARSWGRGIAVGALVATIAGNGLEHAIAAGLVRPTLPLVLAVGATIPASLWAIVHLAAVMSQPAQRGAGKSRGNVGATRAPRTKSVTTPAGLASVPDGDRRLRGLDREAMAQWLRTQTPERPSAEHQAIMGRFGCGLTLAKQVRATVRGGQVRATGS